MDWLLTTGWPVLIWAIVYTSDYYLTLISASLYQSGANQHVSLASGIELTPTFQKDIASLRKISPRFLIALVMLTGALAYFWFASVRTPETRDLYEFVLGALLLLEAAVHLRHIRSLTSLWYARQSLGMSGQIEYAAWFSYRLSAIELISVSGLWLILALLFGQMFFFGGFVTTLLTGLAHWRYSNRARWLEKSRSAAGQQL